MISLKRTTSADSDFQHLVRQLDKDLWSRYPEEQHVYEVFNGVEGIATVVVAYQDNAPVGCGCFKPFGREGVEVKRMFVQSDQRGRGIAFGILSELERWAKELGYTFAVLETGPRQLEAIGLYRKSGYEVMDNYPPYVGMDSSICFRKALSSVLDAKQA